MVLLQFVKLCRPKAHGVMNPESPNIAKQRKYLAGHGIRLRTSRCTSSGAARLRSRSNVIELPPYKRSRARKPSQSRRSARLPFLRLTTVCSRAGEPERTQRRVSIQVGANSAPSYTFLAQAQPGVLGKLRHVRRQRRVAPRGVRGWPRPPRVAETFNQVAVSTRIIGAA